MVSEISIIPVSHSQLLVLTHSWNDHVWEKCSDGDVVLLECTVAVTVFTGRVQLKCDGTRWRTGGEVKGKLANGVG